MSISATPVQLMDPNTGTPYSAAPSADRATAANQTAGNTTSQGIRDNQTNGTQVTRLYGTPNFVTGQIAVTTSSTQVVAARSGRQKITITPTSSVVFYVGNTGVTNSNGLYVAAGAAVTLDTQAAVFAVGASNVTLSFAEYF